MILQPVNLSTGPVNISSEVTSALSQPAISHRSRQFRELFDNTTDILCRMFSVRETFIMSGSGTLANEIMLHQVKLLGSTGLVLSNGEFGSRLIHQAGRISLSFIKYETGWGQAFDMGKVESILSGGDIKWVLFCHCETSTGVLNDMDALAKLCASYKCLCFVDCISSVGTMPVNLSKISMATASSGKGLASYPGLALLFSNIKPLAGHTIPIYYDLSYYSDKNNIPFTISSNLVNALHTSIVQKMSRDQTGLIQKYCNRYFEILQARNLVPFSNIHSRVFTIVLPKAKTGIFVHEMAHKNIILSYESEYLKQRDWIQLAVFGYYSQSELNFVSGVLDCSLQDTFRS